MMAKKILIIYASIGAGHKSAALSIESVLKEKAKNVKVTLLDILTQTKILFIKTLPRLQGNLSEFTGLIYDSLWESKKVAALSHLFRNRLSQKIYHQINQKVLEKEKFDLVVTTHNLATSAISLAKNKGLLSIPHIAVATDLGLNAYWPKTGLDYFIVPTDEMKKELKNLGVKGEIKVFGIPVDPRLTQEVDKQKVLKKYHLNPKLPFVLIMAGTSSKGPYKFAREIIKKMVFEELKPNLPFSIIIKSEGDFKEIIEKEIKKKSLKNLQSLDFIEDFWKLLLSADLLVSKPGGLITAESRAAAVPMLLLGPYFGQERANASYLLKMGLAEDLKPKESLLSAIFKMVTNKKRLAKIRQNLGKFNQGKAALKVANLILS